ncbi:MAG: KAP family NTPase [Acidobacteria bacterium]|nr:KAP family NTPase [Acidobacteriota bacterium]
MIIDKPLSITEILANETERDNFFLLFDLIDRLVEDSRDIKKGKGKGSVSIAVNGDWGCGKTTYLKTLESFYRDFCGFPVVFFEAWKYHEDENPLVPLIMEIKESSGISPQLKAKFTRVFKPIAAAGLTLSDMMLHSLTGKNLDDIEKNLKRVEDEFYKRSSKYRNNFKELEEAIKGLTRKFKPAKINPVYQKEWQQFMRRNHR